MSNHLSPSRTSLNIKKTTTLDVGNYGLCLEQAQKCGGVKLITGSSTAMHTITYNCSGNISDVFRIII